MLVEGTTIFKTFLTTHDTYMGETTGKFNVQLKLDGKTASKLTKDGVKIKEYEGEPIRKFTSRYDVPVYINKDEKWSGELPSGTKVRLEYITKKHPQAGEVPYMKGILVLEMGDDADVKGNAALFSDEPLF